MTPIGAADWVRLGALVLVARQPWRRLQDWLKLSSIKNRGATFRYSSGFS
jgi:hypothetical protein